MNIGACTKYLKIRKILWKCKENNNGGMFQTPIIYLTDSFFIIPPVTLLDEEVEDLFFSVF